MIRFAFVGAVLTLVLGCGGSSTSVTMNAQQNSARTGTASLTEKDGNLEVGVSLSGGADTGSQPAHIHEGTCAAPGAVVKALTNVVSGASTTTIASTKMADVKGKIINVHDSADVTKYVSCGTIP